MRRSLALAAVLALLASADAGAAAPSSGIRGRVLIGPTCPVQRVPPDPRCGPRPLSTRLVVLRASDRRRVGSVRSRRDGRFGIRLRPGRYWVRPARSGGYPFARPVLVTVRAHHFSRVTIMFDSGIR